jgi:hypothetical protein
MLIIDTPKIKASSILLGLNLNLVLSQPLHFFFFCQGTVLGLNLGLHCC